MSKGSGDDNNTDHNPWSRGSSASSSRPSSSLELPRCAANMVDLWDESHGIFGQIIEPSILVKALERTDGNMVGAIDDPTMAQIRTVLRSLTISHEEIVVEFENWSNVELFVRWMDENGHNPIDTHYFPLAPQTTLVQYSQPGHLFVVWSATELFGAYRILKALPSGSAHCVLIESVTAADDEEAEETGTELASTNSSAFRLEAILTDESKRDAFTVVAAALEQTGRRHVSTLHTIVNNILQHPDDAKYRKLRLSNKTIQRHIINCPASLHMLHLLGFDQTDECLLLLDPNLERCHIALELLNLLQQRMGTECLELAPVAPWQAPDVMGTAHFAAHSGTHFVTPDERWDRIERWNSLRGGASGRRPRRPDPGNAPSSRGRWGR